mmetsp:Transcript_72075/g.127407  ORF Transcript_72075/g.127407 Transcript_72075/m.127407 type:complete len:206 (-) Transcript_72075:353-970(-)
MPSWSLTTSTSWPPRLTSSGWSQVGSRLHQRRPVLKPRLHRIRLVLRQEMVSWTPNMLRLKVLRLWCPESLPSRSPERSAWSACKQLTSSEQRIQSLWGACKSWKETLAKGASSWRNSKHKSGPGSCSGLNRKARCRGCTSERRCTCWDRWTGLLQKSTDFRMSQHYAMKLKQWQLLQKRLRRRLPSMLPALNDSCNAAQSRFIS